ncbi:putative tail fiber protein [Escherichia phage PGN590]|uniref:Putative tail fiber protein n=1 Tax=Escherichia phage PGN590 TaxID=2714735 RepID=A0A6M9E8A1_9CAUD|nr:putative tail fiber protein [Escherichia phage PGN590]QKL16956.1 putative tail fiber protein [Escherichia phage PGN590]
MEYVNSSSSSPLPILVTTYCCNAISVRSIAKTVSGLTSNPNPMFSSMVFPSPLTFEIVRLTGFPSGLLMIMKSPGRASILNGANTCKPETSITRPDRFNLRLLL